MTRKKILFVAGWRTELGDFIGEHYQASKLHHDVTYLHIDYVKKLKLGQLWSIKEESIHGDPDQVMITISCYLRRWGIYEYLINKALDRFLQKRGTRFDLVHLNVRTPVTEVIALNRHIQQLPVVLTEHSSFYHTGIHVRYPDPEERKQEMERVKTWFKDARPLFILPVSRQLGDVLVNQFDIHAEQIRVVPNVSAPQYNLLPDRPRTEDGRLRLLLVGFWSYPKNLMLFARALKELDPERQRRMDIHLIGDGDLVPEFLAYISSELPELKLTFYGMVGDKAQLARQYNDADFLIHPTDAENLPCVIIESLCCGTPVLSNRINGVVELIEPGRNGFMSPRSDVAEFRKYLEQIIDGKMLFDRRAIHERAIAKYSATTVAAQLSRTYDEAVEIGALGTQNPSRPYHQCNKCLMDTKDDPRIQFDERGVCSYCHAYKRLEKRRLFLEGNKEQMLDELIVKIKKSKTNERYDCILGVSGGVDSTYVAVKLKERGLTPLLVHLDNGWNSELAVMNIQNIVDKLNLDLDTYVIDWEEFRDIQLAFMKASVVDIELVTDFAIVACLYNLADKLGIKYIISGHNFATEAIMPSTWIHEKGDLLNIEAIYRTYYGKRLKTFPKLGYMKKNYLVYFKGIKVVPFLNYIDYNKESAKKEMAEKLQWKDYGSKHGESIFTKFYQNYILPEKFHIDKRKAHLSSLICSGQMSREEAINEISRPLYAPKELANDLDYIIKKFGLSREAFDAIMQGPIRQHSDFPSYVTREYRLERIWLKRLKPLTKIFKKLTGFNPESNYV